MKNKVHLLSHYPFILAGYVFFCFCVSCQSQNKNFELVTVPSSDLPSRIRGENTQKSSPQLLGGKKGEIWSVWKILLHECMQNDLFQDPTYLGLSNTLGVGSVYSKSDNLWEWDLNKLLDSTQRSEVITYGQPQPCGYIQNTSKDFGIFLAANIPSIGIDAELALAIKNQKDISVKIDGWEIDNLIVGEFEDLLKNSTSPKLVAFRNDLVHKKFYIVSKVVRVTGFSALVSLDTELSDSLSIQLKNGIVHNIGSYGALVKFEYASKTQIKISSIGSFVVFAEFIKSKKLNDDE